MTIVATTSAPALWRSEKTVDRSGHRLHPHRPSPLSVGFVAPSMPAQIIFRPEALAASMARTITLRHAPAALLERWARAQLLEIEYMVADGKAFALSPDLDALADAERSGFAGRVGAGVTDLLMNALGYVWRDNAMCLSSSLDPHADFIYGGGPVTGHGVVLAEAHGSFAQSVSDSRIDGEARRKYLRQVKPHVGRSCVHGKVVHGYSIAFGSHPTAHDTYLHIAETKISKGKKKSGPVPVPAAPLVSTSLALAAHRTNFLLMGAYRIVAWIDWLRGVGERPDDSFDAAFFVVDLAERRYWVSMGTLLLYLRPWLLPDHRDWRWHWDDVERWRRVLGRGPHNVFAMEDLAAKSFMMTLSALIGGGRERLPEVLGLPVIEPTGLLDTPGRDAPEEDRYPVTQYGDGLALLARLPRLDRPGTRIWSPKQGIG
ncbi:hypothetical protein [Bradyrhizobium ivorense]|uniref:hypothetical protein n=1 Tax=Bradyrhizobium ivorense TaxID=2511166 RepID=UPI0011167A57|nr:hypothetical protein [Bradyrhizobium ivorense]